MIYKPKHRQVEVTTSSVADIAFLLLSFFLMTTVINSEKGLTITLPEWRDRQVEVPILERNVFKVQVNSSDELLVEGERMAGTAGLKARVKEFVLNNGRIASLSENPKDAVVSMKTDRGTTHEVFMAVLDEIQGAYYEIYAERLGISVDAFRSLNSQRASDRKLIERAKDGIPMNISMANPIGIAN